MKDGKNVSITDAVDILLLIIIGYGFLIIASNRTGFTLLIPLTSYPRLNLGLVMLVVGWSALSMRYGFKREEKRRRR